MEERVKQKVEVKNKAKAAARPPHTTDKTEEYIFVSGENQTIDKTNRNKLRLEINANSKLLNRILINGKQLSEKDYTIDKDKLIIEINNELYISNETYVINLNTEDKNNLTQNVQHMS